MSPLMQYNYTSFVHKEEVTSICGETFEDVICINENFHRHKEDILVCSGASDTCQASILFLKRGQVSSRPLFFLLVKPSNARSQHLQYIMV